MRINVVRPRSDADWETLAAQWREVEARADGSFFQSWTWVGCRLRERFTDPFVIQAMDGAQMVGLALFNRTGLPLRRTLYLHETGRRGEDSVFIEHNGPLLARGRADLLRPMLAAALAHGRLVLSGVPDHVRSAAASLGRCRVRATRPAPFAPLAGLTEAGWLAGLGASTRYQLRRSRRRYEAAGRLVAERAASVAEGLAFLDALAALHQTHWVARGHAGAFATPAFVAFHRALVARGLPRGEVELVRVSTVDPAGSRPIGYLYNFCWRDRVYAYQSGFDYAAAQPHQVPGLTCHHVAIEAAIRSGRAVYDFLAGAARYKTSLGSDALAMHWLALRRAGRSKGSWQPDCDQIFGDTPQTRATCPPPGT